MHKGSCLCGASASRWDGALPPPDGCHCVQCRRHSGHYFVSTDVPRGRVTIRGEDKVTWYRSSEKVRRGFCSVCRLVAVLGPGPPRLHRHRDGRVRDAHRHDTWTCTSSSRRRAITTRSPTACRRTCADQGSSRRLKQLERLAVPVERGIDACFRAQNDNVSLGPHSLIGQFQECYATRLCITQRQRLRIPDRRLEIAPGRRRRDSR